MKRNFIWSSKDISTSATAWQNKRNYAYGSKLWKCQKRATLCTTVSWVANASSWCWRQEPVSHTGLHWGIAVTGSGGWARGWLWGLWRVIIIKGERGDYLRWRGEWYSCWWYWRWCGMCHVQWYSYKGCSWVKQRVRKRNDKVSVEKKYKWNGKHRWYTLILSLGWCETAD